MEERAIHISSINREKRGTSRPGDFTIKFNPSLKLDPDKTHQLALDRLSMTYSWYNNIIVQLLSTKNIENCSL